MRTKLSTRQPEVPSTLQPEFAQTMLPEPSALDIRALKRAGWARLGAVTAIFDDAGKLLMLEHRGSDQYPEGALGPLAETAQIASTGSSVAVETTAHTLSRAIYEELGVQEPSSLNLKARKIAAWTLNNWPVGVGYNVNQALAICPVVHINPESQEQLLDTFDGTEEIAGVKFMNPDEIPTLDLVRPGTNDWLDDVMRSGLAQNKQRLTPVNMPNPQPLTHGIDIKMAEIAYL